MHISLEEAISMFNSWKAAGTVLQASSSVIGPNRQLQATVIGIRGTVIDISDGEKETEVNLADAEFNGDRRSAPNAKHGAYLVCEYRNGDRWSFYSPHAAQPEVPAASERR